WDAKAKVPAGILSGNLNSLGNYDECVAVRNIDTEAGVIDAQYCLTTISDVDVSSLGVLGNLAELNDEEDKIRLG
ncbi:hypothetical protein L9F63_015469, partial [Diploptera punctata]